MTPGSAFAHVSKPSNDDDAISEQRGAVEICGREDRLSDSRKSQPIRPGRGRRHRCRCRNRGRRSPHARQRCRSICRQDAAFGLHPSGRNSRSALSSSHRPGQEYPKLIGRMSDLGRLRLVRLVTQAALLRCPDHPLPELERLALGLVVPKRRCCWLSKTLRLIFKSRSRDGTGGAARAG